MRYVIITLFSLLISIGVLAKDYSKDDFNKLMRNYLQALQNKDEKALSDVTSKNFLRKFRGSGQMKQVFNAQKEKSVGKFDLTFKKALVEKDLYLLNIKNPEDQDYDEYWYFVKDKKGKLIIDEIQPLK